MKNITNIYKLIGLSLFSTMIIEATPPKNIFLGIKNASSSNIIAYFIEENQFPKIFEAQGWTDKASEAALNLSNAAIAMADRIQLKQNIISKYKDLENENKKLKQNLEKKETQLTELKKNNSQYKQLASEIEELKNQIKEHEKDLSALKNKYEKATKKVETKEKAENWIKTGQEIVKGMGEFISTFLPDMVVASIKKKDSSGLLFPGGKKYWTKSESNVKDARGIVFAAFKEDDKYKGLPDFGTLLFVRNIGKDSAGNPKYNYIKYLGKGKALFCKYGYDNKGNWTKIAEREKIYAPMSLENQSVNYKEEARDIAQELKSEETATDEEAQKLFDIDL